MRKMMKFCILVIFLLLRTYNIILFTMKNGDLERMIWVPEYVPPQKASLDTASHFQIIQAMFWEHSSSQQFLVSVGDFLTGSSTLSKS